MAKMCIRDSRHTVTRGFFTVNLNVDIAPTFQTLSKRRSYAWHRSCPFFNLLSHRVDIRQHSTGNFNSDVAFNASREPVSYTHLGNAQTTGDLAGANYIAGAGAYTYNEPGRTWYMSINTHF